MKFRKESHFQPHIFESINRYSAWKISNIGYIPPWPPLPFLLFVVPSYRIFESGKPATADITTAEHSILVLYSKRRQYTFVIILSSSSSSSSPPIPLNNEKKNHRGKSNPDTLISPPPPNLYITALGLTQYSAQNPLASSQKPRGGVFPHSPPRK